MKRSISIALPLLAIFFMSCGDSDSSSDVPVTPEEESVVTPSDCYEAFSLAYPDIDASSVEWITKDDYLIARFDNINARAEGTLTDIWYELAGEDYLTEEFIDVEDVPSLLSDAFAEIMAGYNRTLEIKSATKGKFKSETFYKIYGEDTNNNGGTSLEYFGEDGTYLGFDEPSIVDGLIVTELPKLYAMQYINKNFDDYILLESDEYYGDYEVSITLFDDRYEPMSFITFVGEDPDNCVEEHEVKLSYVDTELLDKVEAAFDENYEVENFCEIYVNRVLTYYQVYAGVNQGDFVGQTYKWFDLSANEIDDPDLY